MAVNQPVQPAPARTLTAGGESRGLMIVGVICFVLAALVFGGVSIITDNGWVWVSAGFASWMLARVLGYWGIW